MRKIFNNSLIYEPVFFDRKNSEDKAKMDSLIESNPFLLLYDEIINQIEELIKLQNPAKQFNSEELALAVNLHIESQNIYDYGVWVYYPWNNNLIHLLKKEDFISVRTNRNCYKITKEEQDLLKNKKIGIIGLSVGQSVALTLAMERACGELRLCDFDILELSNYNRIRTKLSNLGLHKTVSVAREIKELDPFLKIRCFHEGLTKENIDDFFLQDGKLDICIDECDSIDMKILCRVKAKEYKIPIVMESSDNCTVDVERFDLEINRPILHGYMDNLDIHKAAQCKTNKEKLPYLMAIMTPQFMTDRMVASLFEIQETINTWPQLASSVAYGGGICGNVCRRILLGTFTESGRYQLNIDSYFGNKEEKKDPIAIPSTCKPSKTSLIRQTNQLSEIAVSVSLENNINHLIKDGGKAPSGGNLQPWLWHFSKTHGLIQFIDKSQKSPLLDYNYSGSLIGLGAAAENVILSANKLKINLDTQFLGLSLVEENDLVCRFIQNKANSHPYPDLVNFIDSRVTNRKLGKRVVIDKVFLKDLKKIVNSIENADLHFITKPEKLEEVSLLYAKIELARLIDTQGHIDFMKEIRWSEEEEKETKDGINVWSLDIDEIDFAGLIACKQRGALEMIRKWNKGGKMINLFKKTIDAAGAVGLITMPTYSNQNLFNGGRALQRVWLAANKNGLAFQPITPVTFLYYRMALGGHGLMDEETKLFLQSLKPTFDGIFNLSVQKKIFMFRLSVTDRKAPKSYRRDSQSLLTFQD